MKKLTAILLLLSFGLLSLTSSDKRSSKFRSWYADNHRSLEVDLSSGGVNWTLTYLPKEVKVLRNLNGKNDLTTKELRDLNKKFGAYTEFSFKIELEGVRDVLLHIAEDQQDFERLTFYMIEQIQKDFALIREKDEIEPLRCSYENNYGAAPFIKLHLVFEKSTKENKMKQLVFFDQLTNQGAQVFDVAHLTELKIPKIK